MEGGNFHRLPTAVPDPGDRPPAPGSLHVVQALVNTLSGHDGADLLVTPAGTAGWLAAAGLLPPGSAVTGTQAGLLRDLREAIRGVLQTHTHGQADPEAAERLSSALLTCRLTVAADPAGGCRLVSADHDPFARAVGAVAVAIAEAGVAGTWARLKSCPGHRCGWAFYDRSASATSRWCDMQLCGSRAKMRALRHRQAGGAGGESRGQAVTSGPAG